jgi:HEPN domain-containing protein
MAHDSFALSVHLARQAGDEALAFRKLAAASDIADEMVGIHAQQAVEGWLAAVIVRRGGEPTRDHDIDRLVQTLQREGVDSLPETDRLRGLSQYAAPLHGEYLLDLDPLDRKATVTLVDEVGEWAKAELQPDG